MRSYAIIFLSIAILFLQGVAVGQTSTKQQFLNLAKSGKLEKMSMDEIRAKLKAYGITVEEAIQMAKERGIDVSKYIKKEEQTSGGQTIPSVAPGQPLPTQTGQPMQQGTGSPVGTAATRGSSVVLDTTAPGGLLPGQLLPGTTPVPAAAQIQITPGIPPGAVTEPETVKSLMPDTGKVPRGVNGLEYFGYEIFKNIPTAFEPSSTGPVDPGYTVGPGDNLRLSVWGQTEFQYELEVDKEGRVFIPNVGQIFVAGTPLNTLQERLKNQLSKYYAGLSANPPTVFLDVTSDKLRPLRVFVMGSVKQPGGYTVSSYATVFNALYAVGGPLVSGSLRNVRVMRNNKLVATVDLYDYLLRGDKSSDIRLQNNDVIFVPPRGKSVAVQGEVFRPAIYELKDKENLRVAIEFAGGLKPTAYFERASIIRVKPFDQRGTDVEGREVVDVPLGDIIRGKREDLVLYDADEITVTDINDDMKNYVSIDGPVWRPDTFEISKTPSLKKLIAAAGGLMPKIYFPVAHIVRMNEDLLTKRIIPLNLGQVMDGTIADIPLRPRDEVHLYSTEVIQVKEKYVTIYGEVKNPGRYFLRDNMTLADLILMAGGYNQEAYLLQGEVARIRPEGMPGDSMAIILHPALPREFSKVASQRYNDSAGTRVIDREDFVLQHRDEILVTTNPDYKEQQNVVINGDIKFPGVYAIERRGETLSQLLARAGGPTITTYLGGAQFFRNDRRLLVDFGEAFYKHNSRHDVQMQNGDRLEIPSNPHTVTVNGEVNNPGILSFIEGDSFADYLNRAGGLTDSSNYGVLIKPTGESQRVNFGFLRGNPNVPEGSTIVVTKVPPPHPEDHFDVSGTIKDTFAILSSAATLMFLVYQVTK